MLEALPFGQTPIGKSRYAFDDRPALSERRWAEVNGEYIDDGDEIWYCGNSAGYRAPEWSEIDWSNAAVFFGDSSTYGHGSAEHNTIPKLFEAETGIESVNLAVPGASSELILYIISVIVNEVTPRMAILNHPSMPRIWDPIGSTGNLGPWLSYATNFAPESYELYEVWTKVSERGVHKCRTNAYIMRTLLKNTPLVEWTWDVKVADLLDIAHYEYFDQPAENLARDGYHANKNINRHIANRIAQCF